MTRIIQISDLHFGDACDRTLDGARAAISALAPDCVVATGDLTQAGRKREFTAAGRWLTGLGLPVVACPGNHDAPVYALHRRFTAPFARFAALGLASQWTSDDGLIQIRALNTARGAQWRADWSQGVWSRADIAAINPPGERLARWSLLACHHPPLAPPGVRLGITTRRGASAAAALAQAARTLLLAGHVHRFTLTPLGAATMITAPTLASSRTRGDGRGFVVLDVTADEVTVTPWRWDGAGHRAEAPVFVTQ